MLLFQYSPKMSATFLLKLSFLGRFLETDIYIMTIRSQHINISTSLGLGEQSFKHANVLSEKINLSAPWGPKSTIFDTDDVDPLYFEVSIVSAPPDPTY